ncbi:MAG TPA: aldose 1-epimerase family protein [Chthonomonadaceae bacterium]|nr:aldose 1-epimerase family protein [Chthonomonadaceae bacterium]
MAQLYGKSYSRKDLLARVGNISQIARIKPYRLVEGQEDGVFALDVTTGGGLGFTLLASRGLDISSAHFNGRSLAWRSATTDTHPAFFDHEGEQGRGWLRGFYGGLVVTCGLTYAGAAGEDQGRFYGLHGRISNLPATNVHWDGRWEGDDYLLTVSGKVREATVFGENLQLTRMVTARLGERRLFLHDTVENLGYKRTEHMLLYHINLGFPVVADNARLIAPTLSATPRDPDAEAGRERFAQMQPPEAGFKEQVYFHDLAPDAQGHVTAAIVNPDCPAADGKPPGLGVYCRYDPRQLPRFSEWKMMDAGTYVVGMEPANCLVMGRAQERAAGTLQFLEPGERRTYALEIGVLAGPEEIARLETACREAVAARQQTAGIPEHLAL